MTLVMKNKKSTMLDTKYFCDLCGFETKYIYDPINTKRGMKLFICKKCGCLQSLSFKNYPSRPEGNMSSDADRASYKYTKTLTSGQYSTLLNKFCLNINTSNILDIGMNRGAFYKWASRNFIYEKFTGIETDASLTDEYCDDKKVNLIIDRVENVDLGSQIFDFAFCVHTLEHVKSANSVLRQVFRALKHGGVFFLAVPNIIFHDDIVEEYFIDTHTFHFQHDVLLNFIKNTGFRVKYCSDPIDSEIIFILEKKHKNYLKNDKIKMNERYNKVLMELRKYEDKIHVNRELISNSVIHINKYCLEKRKCFIWGAGRIFDCLIKFEG